MLSIISYVFHFLILELTNKTINLLTLHMGGRATNFNWKDTSKIGPDITFSEDPSISLPMTNS